MIQSVERAAAILAVLGSGTPRLGVTEIAERVGLAKPTTHGLLRALVAHDLVAQDPASGKYSLGPGVLQLGASSGQQVTVRAVGPDADKAVQTLAGILAGVSKVGD